MPQRLIKTRSRFFLAGEGESEQSFVKWLQELSEQAELHVHLQCDLLGGGGYKTMMDRAIIYRRRGLKKGDYKRSFLLVDGDRGLSGRDWPIEKLEREALANNFILCCQRPSFEALLLRMSPGKEKAIVPNTASAMSQIMSVWPTYQKPVDARMLARKYSLDDLKRLGAHNMELEFLLKEIGLLK